MRLLQDAPSPIYYQDADRIVRALNASLSDDPDGWRARVVDVQPGRAGKYVYIELYDAEGHVGWWATS